MASHQQFSAGQRQVPVDLHQWDDKTRQTISQIAGEVVRRLKKGLPDLHSTAIAIEQNVVCFADVESIARGSHLRVKPSAVVTPSALDHCRQNSITIVRQNESQLKGQGASSNWAQKENWELNESALGSAIYGRCRSEGLDDLSTRVCLSDQPFKSMARYLRTAQTACVVHQISQVDRAERELQPKVWIVDTLNQSLVPMVNLIRQIRNVTGHRKHRSEEQA